MIAPARYVVAGLALVIATRGATASQPTPPPLPRVALTGGVVIDGTGRAPIVDGVVLVDGETIRAVGQRREIAVPPDFRVIDVSGKWVLPGFIDLHVHLTYPTSMPQYTKEGLALVSDSEAALRALSFMNSFLRKGITAVRDVNGLVSPLQALMRGAREGWINSVRLFPVGRLITSTGGHGTLPIAREANGPWDFRLAVRENFKAGFRHIKLSPTFTKEEVEAAVDEARIHHMVVTSHGGGQSDTWPQTSMTRIAVEAGVQCIEHLNQMDIDVLDLIAAKGVHVVPTLTVYREQYRLGVVPRELVERRGWTQQMHETLFREARRRNITMGIGTDAVGRFRSLYPDMFFTEMKYFVELGASPMEAIISASKNGGVILGEGPRLGTLEPGKLADLQVVGGDPLRSLDALGNPELVMVGGKLHRFDRDQ